MSDPAKLLYTFLCLAADRRGMSFYGEKRIQSHFHLETHVIDNARKELIQKDLIAYDGRNYQVLSLPTSQPEPAPKIQKVGEPTIKRVGEPERFSDILSRLAGAAR
jgi:hypothetical protein